MIRVIVRALLIYSVSGIWAPPASAGEDMSIGRMRVMVWPEYDDTGVLVVYDGRFVEDGRFPTKTSFFIPKGVVINDVCSLSPGGQHFCQLYDIEEGGAQDIAHLSLPFSNFYLSFHTAALDVNKENRKIDFRLKTNHAIRRLEIDVQQPLRSSGFSISPGGGEVKERKGFNHYKYTLEDIAKGEERAFAINYVKKDPNPSVDIKFSNMSGPRIWGSPYETQRNMRTLIYVIFATGMAAVAAGVAWIVILGRRKPRT